MAAQHRTGIGRGSTQCLYNYKSRYAYSIPKPSVKVEMSSNYLQKLDSNDDDPNEQQAEGVFS